MQAGNALGHHQSLWGRPPNTSHGSTVYAQRQRLGVAFRPAQSSTGEEVAGMIKSNSEPVESMLPGSILCHSQLQTYNCDVIVNSPRNPLGGINHATHLRHPHLIYHQHHDRHEDARHVDEFHTVLLRDSCLPVLFLSLQLVSIHNFHSSALLIEHFCFLAISHFPSATPPCLHSPAHI